LADGPPVKKHRRFTDESERSQVLSELRLESERLV